ncbi:hypothetical protein, partial [Musicola paradisiaca]|uniref:hypothetical protein n=1 Tax=Musicola paradisiaca TaxID=69223 RepID=UPI003F26C8D8
GLSLLSRGGVYYAFLIWSQRLFSSFSVLNRVVLCISASQWWRIIGTSPQAATGIFQKNDRSLNSTAKAPLIPDCPQSYPHQLHFLKFLERHANVFATISPRNKAGNTAPVVT